MKQLTLEGYQVAYSCKCGKSFETMSNLKKHHSKSHKIKRETTEINFALENFRLISTKKTEYSFDANFSPISMVSEVK